MTEEQETYAPGAMIVAPSTAIGQLADLPDLRQYGFRFHEHGLTLLDTPEPEQFKCAGFLLGLYGTQMNLRARAWQLGFGDWLNYGENLYGEAASQYVDDVCEGALDFDVDTLSGYKSVAQRIPPALRRGELDYSHMKEIAYAIDSPDLRPLWVDWAAEEQRKRKANGERRLSVRELRDRIRKASERSDKPEPKDGDPDQDDDDEGEGKGAEDEDKSKFVPVDCPHCHYHFEIEV